MENFAEEPKQALFVLCDYKLEQTIACSKGPHSEADSSSGPANKADGGSCRNLTVAPTGICYSFVQKH